MNKSLFLIAFTFLTTLTSFAQDKKGYSLNFQDPESVVGAIFYAAQTKDYTILQLLCDPLDQGDKDTKGLCAIPDIAKQADPSTESDYPANMVDIFVQMFEKGRVTGKVTFEKGEDGTEYAKVPFEYIHPNGGSRNSEVMKLVKRYGNWYLSSF